jgi:hypothetical protein
MLVGVGLLLVGGALLLWGEPIAYSYIPITPTPSLTPTTSITPTITLTPTISLTPTITLTPAVTDTPTITPTPHIPLAVEAQFESSITPNPDAVFSPIEFSQSLDALFRPVDPGTEFQNPVGEMFAVFTYDGMALGSQWTALWYRNGELVNYETKPWIDGTGGAGYSDWQPDPEEWQAGNYQVQIFVGLEWKVVGDFVILGDPPTPTLPPSNTPAPSATSTITVTPTAGPTSTRTATRTPYPTLTLTVKPTAWPTPTPTPITPSPTPYPTLTQTITRTPWPTATFVEEE